MFLQILFQTNHTLAGIRQNSRELKYFKNKEWLKSAYFETGNIKDFLYLFPMYAMICMNQILW